MTKLLVTDAADFRFWPNFNLLNAVRGFSTIVAVLLFTSGSIFAADSPVIAPGAKLEKLGEGFTGPEAPAADRDGNVFFTELSKNRIVKWNAADGKFSEWLTPSGLAKGLYFDKAGNLLATAVEKGELWSIAPDKTVTVLATNFGGKQFNGPKDLWISPDGGVYFTDPYFTERFMIRDPNARMAGQHVYFMAPDRRTVTQATTDLSRPYGIIGTPEGKVLYVGELVGLSIWAYDILPDGELTNKRLFYDRSSQGITIDVEGNVYRTWSEGVTVLDKTGREIEQIHMPKGSSLNLNVTFGGKDRDLLFITGWGDVYGLKMRVKGAD